MRKREKGFLITTEKHELIIVRNGPGSSIRQCCPYCGADADFVTFDVAMHVSGLSGRDLVRGIGTGAVHALEVPGELFAICSESLRTDKEGARDEKK